jgi:hypothetical protein
MLELSRYVSKLDVHRMDHEGLFNHITSILSDENIYMANSFNDPAINKEIILTALKSGNALSYRHAIALTERLKKLATTDESLNKNFAQFILRHKQTNHWDKKKIWVVLFIVLLICFIIFFAGK